MRCGTKNSVAGAMIFLGIGIIADKFLSGGSIALAVVFMAAGIWLLCCER